MTTNSPSGASIVKVKDTNKSIAVTVDYNSRYVYADPEKGCAIALADGGLIHYAPGICYAK